MKIRVNSTKRRKITQDKITIEVQQDRSFEIGLDLREEKFPKYARVYLEVTCAGNSFVPRFDLGKVQDQIIYADTLDLSNVKRFTFYVKVVDVRDEIGKILGFAKVPVSVKGEEGSLLHLQISEDLGDIPWQLSLSDGTVLLVNAKYQNLYQELFSDTAARLLILPVVFRDILKHALAEMRDDEEEAFSIWDKWLTLGRELTQSECPADGADDEIEEWIRDAVDALCKKHNFVVKYNQIKEK